MIFCNCLYIMLCMEPLDITHFLQHGSYKGRHVCMRYQDISFCDNSKRYSLGGENTAEDFSLFENNIEYMFVDNLLEMISVDPRTQLLSLENGFILSGVTWLKDFLDHIETLWIDRAIHSPHSFDKQIVIVLTSWVRVSFLYHSSIGFVIDKLQIYAAQ